MIELLDGVSLGFERESPPQGSMLRGFLVQCGCRWRRPTPLCCPAPCYQALTMPHCRVPEQQKRQTLRPPRDPAAHCGPATSPLCYGEPAAQVDPSTLEFLSLLVDQGPTARILALFTFGRTSVHPGQALTSRR